MIESPAEFLKVVMEMRQQQMSYFRSRSAHALCRAKELERKVDEYIEAHKQPEQPDTQQSLFA